MLDFGLSRFDFPQQTRARDFWRVTAKSASCIQQQIDFLHQEGRRAKSCHSAACGESAGTQHGHCGDAAEPRCGVLVKKKAKCLALTLHHPRPTQLEMVSMSPQVKVPGRPPVPPYCTVDAMDTRSCFAALLQPSSGAAGMHTPLHCPKDSSTHIMPCPSHRTVA